MAYASQGGEARTIAERSAAQLNAAGLSAQAVPLEALDLSRLPPRLLLVASTYGDGEAPDHAARFARRLEETTLDLRTVAFALLGLGDRHYPRFCAFAHQLDRCLRTRGASALFDTLEVDRLDAAVLRRWQQQLGQLAGNTEYIDWQAADYQPWVLKHRRCLNPGSQGAALFHLQLVPTAGAEWRAGDLVAVGARHGAEAVADLLDSLHLDGDSTLANGRPLADELSRRQWPDHPATLHGLDATSLLDISPAWRTVPTPSPRRPRTATWTYWYVRSVIQAGVSASDRAGGVDTPPWARPSTCACAATRPSNCPMPAAR